MPAVCRGRLSRACGLQQPAVRACSPQRPGAGRAARHARRSRPPPQVAGRWSQLACCLVVPAIVMSYQPAAASRQLGRPTQAERWRTVARALPAPSPLPAELPCMQAPAPPLPCALCRISDTTVAFAMCRAVPEIVDGGCRQQGVAWPVEAVGWRKRCAYACVRGAGRISWAAGPYPRPCRVCLSNVAVLRPLAEVEDSANFEIK